MNITFYLPTLTQPRHHKRIYSLRDRYFVKVYAFDRGLYRKNALKIDALYILGEMANKSYFKRLQAYIKLIKSILNERNHTDLFYFFTIDFALIGFLFLKRNRYIYEIGDFAYLGFGTAFRNILTKLDAKIIKKSFLTILTSEGFKRYLTKFVQASDISKNTLVIPNRLSDKILQFERNTAPFQEVSSLSFGFAGLLRYPDTILRFAKIIGDRYSNHQFHFFGDGPMRNQVEELVKKYKNIFFHGPYKNPEEIGKIYRMIDICVACYDTNGLNQRLAEPNKLYEAIYFGTPIIVSKDTYLAEVVISKGIGYTVDAHYDEEIIALLDNLTLKSLNKTRSKQLEIASDELLYSEREIIQYIETSESYPTV